VTLADDPAVLAAVVAERRRRRRPVLTLLLICLLLLGLVAGGLAVLRHAPLEHGSGILAFGRYDGQETEGTRTDQTIENVLGVEFRIVDPEVGTPLMLAFGLYNAGRLDVEILDVGLPFPDYYFSKTEAFASDPRGGSGLPYTPLEPFTLEAGGNREVGVRFTVTGCPDGPAERSPGTISAQHVPVTWRFLGVTRISQVPLTFAASLAGYPQCR
jgi:hypothetical protein